MAQPHHFPDRIEELLGQDAAIADSAAHTMLQHLYAFDYQLAIPPLAEDITSLLAGDSGGSLSKRTLRLTDPLGGKAIGIRADITAQISRIDRQHFGKGVARLCYCGPTIYSRPTKPWLNREQLQLGAELFGDASPSASAEIVMLALQCLTLARAQNLTVAVGHAGLAGQLLDGAAAVPARQAAQALAKRDATAIAQLAGALGAARVRALGKLAAMQGEREQLAQWRSSLPADEFFTAAFAELDEFCALLEQAGRSYTIDLASAGGYHYHNGIAFAVLSAETTVAQGGRYGNDGRTATGFTVDLRALLALLPEPAALRHFASRRAYADPGWNDAVADLLKQGWRCVLVDDWPAGKAFCAHRLLHADGRWQLQSWQ